MKFSLIILSSLLALSANANDLNTANLDPAYHSISEVEVNDLSDLSQEELNAYFDSTEDSVMKAKVDWRASDENVHFKATNTTKPLDLLKEGGQLVGKLSRMIKIGKMVYKIIEANKPVVNSSFTALSVVPEAATSWMDMENWRAPKSKTYEVLYKNTYGVTVVRFAYRLNYTYGGTYKGKGRYLSNVQVSPVNVRVLWGYTLNSDVAAKNVQNTGDNNNPVPAVELLVNYHVKTIFVDDKGAEVLYVRGDGYASQLQ